MGPKKKDKKGDDGDALTRIAIVGADKYVNAFGRLVVVWSASPCIYSLCLEYEVGWISMGGVDHRRHGHCRVLSRHDLVSGRWMVAFLGVFHPIG